MTSMIYITITATVEHDGIRVSRQRCHLYLPRVAGIMYKNTSLHIDDLIITTGQDPAGTFTKLKGTDVTVSGGQWDYNKERFASMISLTVGRKGSSEVAEWWKQRFTDSVSLVEHNTKKETF